MIEVFFSTDPKTCVHSYPDLPHCTWRLAPFLLGGGCVVQSVSVSVGVACTRSSLFFYFVSEFVYNYGSMMTRVKRNLHNQHHICITITFLGQECSPPRGDALSLSYPESQPLLIWYD